MLSLKNNMIEVPLSYYEKLYKKLNPIKVARRCNIDYDNFAKKFLINFMGQDFYISFPEFKVEVKGDNPIHTILISSSYARILMIRYLIVGKALPHSGEFCSYREFPWGEVYYKQFNERCINRLARTFGKRTESLVSLMDLIKAKSIKGADYGYEIEFIKGLYIRLLLWEADDEFNPSAQILFSDNFHYAFSAEDLAVIGDITIEMLNEK